MEKLDIDTKEKLYDVIERENVELRNRVKKLETELAIAKRQEETGVEFLMETTG
jgi:cell division protein FtsB